MRNIMQNPQYDGPTGDNGKNNTKNHKKSKTIKVSKSLAGVSQDQNASTPSRMFAQFESTLKINRNKQPKLISSRSLSQLVPRALFFRRNKDKFGNEKQATANIQEQAGKLVTTKSFPSTAFHSTAMDLMDKGQIYVDRVNSESLIGLPGQSSSGCFFENQTTDQITLEQPNFSPIIGGGSRLRGGKILHSLTIEGSENQSGQQQVAVEQSTDQVEVEKVSRSKRDKRKPQQDKSGQSEEEAKKKKDQGGKYKPFKSTTLVLRDVKNSIGLRIRAKHESQAFSKLTNELSTPPTKLYSPFNIYTNSGTKESKSKRKLNLNKNNNNKTDSGIASDNGDSSLISNDSHDFEGETPKRRIALQHKKHLMQETANKFSFVSPTGKLRETVKDVEQFQQCIEDISKAIRARDQSR